MKRQLIDLTGRIFGKLKVVERGLNYRGCARWVCQCECGNETTVRSSCLLTEKTKSCGCLWREWLLQKRTKRPFESLYNILKSKASRRGLTVEISYEEFLTLTSTPFCHYCETPIVWSKHNHRENGSGYYLDRKDSQQGYTKSNSVVCCKRCNRAKSNGFSYEEWVAVGNTIKEYRKHK